MDLAKIQAIFHKAVHPGTPLPEAKLFAKKFRQVVEPDNRFSWWRFSGEFCSQNSAYKITHFYNFKVRMLDLWKMLDEGDATAAGAFSARSTTGKTKTSFTFTRSEPSASGVNAEFEYGSGNRTRKAQSRRTKTDNSWRYDKIRCPGPEYIWIEEYIYSTRTGRIVIVRGHWRERRIGAPKADTSWKFDRTSHPGPGWTWTEGFTKRSGVTVRGHWRALWASCKQGA